MGLLQLTPRRGLALGSALVAAAALAGCGSPGPDATVQPSAAQAVAQTWVDFIDSTILADDPSDLERAVLADHWVDDAELRSAQDALRSCLERQGYHDVKFGPGSAVEFAIPDDLEVAEGDSPYQSCPGTYDPIGALYFDMRDNPQKLTYAQMLRECFDRHGLDEGKDLTDDQFADLVTKAGYQPADPQAQACADDPSI